MTNPDWDVGTHGGRDRERIAISTLKAWPKGLKYLIVCFLVRTEMTIFEVDAWHWELLFNDCYQRKKFLHWQFFSWTQSAEQQKNLIQHENNSTVILVLQIFAMVEGVAQLGSSIHSFNPFGLDSNPIIKIMICIFVDRSAKTKKRKQTVNGLVIAKLLTGRSHMTSFSHSPTHL